jgi:Glycine zipper
MHRKKGDRSMSKLKGLHVLMGPAALIVSAALSAQAPTAAPPAASPAPAPSQFMSQSLGLHVFPAKEQSASQQQSDEGYCFNWAKSNTGFDPLAPPPSSATATAQQPGNPASGAPVRGAVGGAAAGAAIGAVAGDAGKGAAIGATAGAVTGVAKRRRAEQAQEQQQQQQGQQTAAAQQQLAAQKAGYNKAFSACMQGKGYTVQ